MDLLEVGKIVNTHGLKGEVKVVSWTDFPDDFENIKTVYAKTHSGETLLTISNIKYQKNNLIIKFSEINSIDDAEKYKNVILSASRDDLGELPEGVYYIADLIGLDVIDDTGRHIGKIKDVFNSGASDIYEVERTGQKSLLLPVIDDVVLNIDIDGHTVTVHIIDGLEDL